MVVSCRFRRGRLLLWISLIGMTFAVFNYVLLEVLIRGDESSQNGHPTILNGTLKRRDEAIYYNIYVPPPGVGSGPTNALRIVRDQMRQRSESAMSDAPLFYTLIGHNATGLACENCQLLQYVPEGDEELTLQALYEHCTKHPSGRVSYIHDKGSYHENLGNERRRRFVTKGVLSEACARMPPDKCNVCVFDFNLIPNWHAGANMFTADCDYIRRLIPPKEYESRLKEMYASLESCETNGLGSACVVRPNATWDDNVLSIGRYAMENWVFSHPRARPCITHHELYLTKRKGPPVNKWKPKLRIGPHQKQYRPYGIFKEPWFTLEGRLFQFHFLYHEKPPESSWFWNFYWFHRLAKSS